MRHVRWLATVLAACLVLAGCTDARRKAGRELAESVRAARRLCKHAIALRADPQYVREVESGRLVPVAATSATRPAAAAVRKVENALKRLERARKDLEKALAANAEAPAAVKADANLMLGQIRLETGRYHLSGAESMRAQARGARHRTQRLLRMVRAKMALVTFYDAVEKMPRDEIEALVKSAAGEARVLADKLKAARAEITTLEGEIDTRSKENKLLFAQASALRDRSEVTGGTEGLKLWEQAREIDKKVNANASRIAANKQRINDLKVDVALLDKQRASTDQRSAVLSRHVGTMAADSAKAGAEKKASRSEAAGLQVEVEAAAAEVVKHCAVAADQEKQAFAALAGAEDRFAGAQRHEREVVKAAQAAQTKAAEPDDILAAKADELQLALMMSMRASANLTMGELRRYQLDTSKANDDLAKSITDSAKLLGQQPPPVVEQLTGYVADPAATHKAAEENYKAAEKEWEDALNVRLRRGEVEKNTQWQYQGRLAQAYLGHYRLTGDKAVLTKAGEMVSKALADKEASPHLAAVRELRRLILEAAGG